MQDIKIMFRQKRGSMLFAKTEVKMCPNPSRDVMIWTQGNETVETDFVKLVFNITKTGRRAIRFYPIEKPNFPPSFVVKKIPHQLDTIIYQHEDFYLIRNIALIKGRIDYALKEEELNYFINDMNLLIEYSYKLGEIEIEEVEDYNEKIEKVEKLTLKGDSTSFNKEKELFFDKAFAILNNFYKNYKEKKW